MTSLASTSIMKSKLCEKNQRFSVIEGDIEAVKNRCENPGNWKLKMKYIWLKMSYILNLSSSTSRICNANKTILKVSLKFWGSIRGEVCLSQ